MYKVSNMQGRSGRDVANQFVITTDEGQVFQSYNSVIAIKYRDARPIELDELYWDYSRTTGKYRNEFLGEDKKTTAAKIKSGEYILKNLNV